MRFSINLHRFFVRFAILLFWGVSIIAFLFIPDPITLFKSEPSINIVTWGGLLDASCLKEFEEQTGIRVYITYFEQNEELFAKLRASGGKEYDLVIPSSYIADSLIQEKLLQKIDKTKLDFWHHIHPLLLDRHFDKGNEYTIPYVWSVYGIAINKRLIASDRIVPSWRMIFDERFVPEPIGMLEEAREAVALAALYLFGGIESIMRSMDEQKIEAIKSLLLKQKEWVSVYADSRIDYLVTSGIAPIMVTNSFDLFNALRQTEDIDFIVPEEGSFIEIDSFAIPSGTKKQDLVYKFLNYLYSPAVLSQYLCKYGLLSPVSNVDFVHERFPFSVPDEKLFSKLHFFRDIMPLSKLTELWIAVKS